MNSWFLIMTLTTSAHGVSVNSLPGFYTHDGCLKAGSAWVQQVKNSSPSFIKPIATCVEKK